MEIVINKTTNNYVLVARIYAAIMGFMDLLGLLWFAGAITGIEYLTGITSAVIAIVVSLFPRKLVGTLIPIKHILIILCFFGIIGQASLIHGYLIALSHIQIFPIILSILLCAAFVIIISELSKRRGRK